MKTILKLLILSFVFSIFFTNCGGNIKHNREEDSEENSSRSMRGTADVELDSVTLSKLKKVYFFSLSVYHEDKLLKGYAEPHDSSQVVAGFQFGDTIPVLEDKKDGWLLVYPTLAQRKYDSSINRAYIKKENLGKLEDLKLNQEDFTLVITQDGTTKHIGDDTLKIEIISEKEFLSKLKAHTSPIEDIKHGVKQENGVLSLVTGNGILNLKDKNPLTDTALHENQSLSYSYEGFNKALNAHMIKCLEHDSCDYKLYSQATADVITSTTGYPAFSENSEFLVDFSYNPHKKDGAKLNLQRRDQKGQYSTLFSCYFEKWTPLQTSDETTSYFWVNNNSIYAKTIILEGNNTSLEGIGNITQYIKISLVFL